MEILARFKARVVLEVNSENGKRLFLRTRMYMIHPYMPGLCNAETIPPFIACPLPITIRTSVRIYYTGLHR